MASLVKNVVLVGASGGLGSFVLKEFLTSPFNVTVLSRQDSKAVFPDGVKVVKTDYSPASLQSAFADNDIVISLIAMNALDKERVIIDAAVAAGIKRFFPAQYGSDSSSDAVVAAAPTLVVMQQTVQHLRKTENEMSWTSLVVGAFFDMGVQDGFLAINPANRTATVWDDGEVPFAATNRRTVAKALVASISGANYEKTRNQYVKIRSHVQTLNDIVASARRITGEPWPVVAKPQLAPFIEDARAKLAEGNLSAGVSLLLGVIFGKEKLGVYEPLWNDILGLPKEELDDSIRTILQSNNA